MLPMDQGIPGHLSLLGLRPGKTLRLASLNVDIGKALAGVDELDNVDNLLAKHDGEANSSNDPGPERIHLVGTSEFKSSGAEGVGEYLSQNRGVDLNTGLESLSAGFLDRLDQVGRQERG